MNGTVTPTAGRAWEFTHNGIEYRIESRAGQDKVDLLWRPAGETGSFAYRSTRHTDSVSARNVEQAWAREITTRS